MQLPVAIAGRRHGRDAIEQTIDRVGRATDRDLVVGRPDLETGAIEFGRDAAGGGWLMRLG